MIDPQLNKLPVEAEDKGKRPEDSLSEAERAERLRRSRAGLSVDDTIAANANLSVGSRGVDVSGVRSGSGAGAGMTRTTPGGAGESPAPNVSPAPRSSGTTPRGEVAPQQTPTMRMNARPAEDEIAARAYRCWQERGCPSGSPEEDWLRAEQELLAEQRTTRTAAASA